jgi:hypothetical protein
MTVVDEGNHYVLVQRCSTVGPAFAEACRDPAGVDRLRVQRDVAELARSFFFEHVEVAR